MTRVCLGYEGHCCDVSLDGAQPQRKRCDPCVRQNTLIVNRKSQREIRKAEKNAPDFFSFEGANMLKSKIEAYWEAKGHRVRCEILKGRYDNSWRRAPYFVRSDMSNGRPTKSQQIGA